ncbi:hypothetical protein [Streptomyces sp. NPDC057257]|uniref:hypothetical protein n=1 Tax=Streptomyces sp. NPDC057257 TaxID=3346071 RepID=UPI00363CAB71
MDNAKRIYRRSERSLIPRRRCPDCQTPIRGRWVEHSSMEPDFDPEGDVSWRCLGEQCLTGKEGF